MKTGRRALPFREKVELFLSYGSGRVIAQDRGSYVMFPGGGVDPGESQALAGAREAMEEVGASASRLRYLVTVDFVWFPAWANTPKRKERYARFQGERVHVYVGRCARLRKATGTEGDCWKGRRTMSVAECARLVEDYGRRDHASTYAYRVAQLSALRCIQMC